MNVQSETRKSHGRLRDLAPFDPEQSTPPAVALSRTGSEAGGAAAENGASAYGCVEWFRYPHRSRQRRRSGTL